MVSQVSSETFTRNAGLTQRVPGYQSSTIISDGRIFTIGGSWSGPRGGKDGEIYDGTTWTNLPGAEVAPILTQDAGGIFRSDNHAWLFPWFENSVFHAGPSSAMLWYNVSGAGSWTAAGTRASDPDSMCGSSVMFDAVNGLILTAGGSPSYQDSFATGNAHLIKLVGLPYYNVPELCPPLLNLKREPNS